jgi:hypothetical protein
MTVDAFPDAAYTLNDLFFAGDKAVWRGTWQATQRKDWEGIAVEYDRYSSFGSWAHSKVCCVKPDHWALAKCSASPHRRA